MIAVAPRIVLDVLCPSKVHHPCHILSQAQYLVMLEGDCGCPAQCTGRFMSEGIHHPVFGDVGG